MTRFDWWLLLGFGLLSGCLMALIAYVWLYWP